VQILCIVRQNGMVLTQCLTMEEAYRYIEWKTRFSIAGMLPLGTALDKSGAARLLAEGVVNLLGPVRMQCCSDYWRLLLWRPVLFHPG